MSHCNKATITPALGANAVRRRSRHGPSIFRITRKNEFAHYGAVRLKNGLRGNKVNRTMHARTRVGDGVEGIVLKLNGFAWFY